MFFPPSSVLCLSLSAWFASSSGEGTSKTPQSSSQALMLMQQGLRGLVVPRACPMSGDKPGSTPWSSAWGTGSADGAPSQGCGQSSSQHAAGCCGRCLQLGAAHGYCVQAQESERALKWGKKIYFARFSSAILGRRNLFIYKDGSGTFHCLPLQQLGLEDLNSKLHFIPNSEGLGSSG